MLVKNLMMILAASSFMAVASAHAEETTGDKMEKSGHDAKRSMQKGMHKAEESVCSEGDAACAAKKVKHKGQEGSTYVKDKTNEAVDKAK